MNEVDDKQSDFNLFLQKQHSDFATSQTIIKQHLGVWLSKSLASMFQMGVLHKFGAS